MLQLHTACLAGEVQSVQVLLNQGKDPCEKDKDGNIPLHWAAHKGNPEIVKMILKVTNDVNAKNDLGNTPLHYAAINNKVEASKLLLEAKADPNAPNENGQTPLHGAVARGGVKLIKVLCEYMLSTSKIPKGATGFKRPFGCADPNRKDNEGFTPLHLCTYRLAGGKIWTALIDVGADKYIIGGEWGTTPIHPFGYNLTKFFKTIPVLLAPFIFMWWFMFRPIIQKMVEDGTWEREYGNYLNSIRQPLLAGFYQIVEMAGLLEYFQ